MWSRLSYIRLASINRSSGLSSPGTTPPFPILGTLKPGFENTSALQGPLSPVPVFSPFGPGASQREELIDSMEDDRLVSFSANVPSYENISPEELRWQEYQANETDSVPLCKFCNNAGSIAPRDLPLSSSTPNTSMSSAGPPSMIQESSPSSSALSALKPTMTVSEPITTVLPSLPVASVNEAQMPYERATVENSLAAPLGTAFNYPSTVPTVQLGISSLPVSEKSSSTRSISLLASSKKVFQKTVIRMQTRRHGSPKRDGPRVSFINDYIDQEN